MSCVPLLVLLREIGLLTDQQITHLGARPESQCDDPRPLCRLLVQRGWMTRWQAARAATRRLRELLVGPYDLLDRLGEGGMGQVYRARDRHTGRVVALKVMRKEKLASAGSVQRFYQEVQAAAKLSHPNIVQAHDAGQAGAAHFFAMELVEGPDLARLVKERGPLPVALA